jgi:Domain of unknown function (DUF4351)
MAKPTQPTTDQDSPWKRILQLYFPEAIAFFFPQIAQLIDWATPPEFLDKEFTKIAPDAKVGRRFADQLVRVKLKRGQDLVLLIHVEVQAAPEKHFAERIFVYSLRIFDYFHQPATSLAILCDASPTWRPCQYNFALPGTRLNFEFSVVKLLDYRDRLAELDASPNPFAMVVKAHLKLQETKQDNPGRKIWKMRLVRQLYEAGYNQQQVLDLFNFIDWVLVLPKRLEADFWTELQAYEEERRMPYITSVERIGYERGQQEGRQALIMKLLKRQLQVAALPDAMQTRIQALAIAQLEDLGEALLDFTNLADLTTWLEQHS